jgi:hypothetical protein
VTLIWFGYIISLSQWGGGGNLLVKMISTCRHGLRGRGRGSGPCGKGEACPSAGGMGYVYYWWVLGGLWTNVGYPQVMWAGLAKNR